MLGDAGNRGPRALPERNLDAISISVLRVILHSVMLGATINNPRVSSVLGGTHLKGWYGYVGGQDPFSRLSRHF